MTKMDWRDLVSVPMDEVRPAPFGPVADAARLLEDTLQEAGFDTFLESTFRSAAPLTVVLNDADRLTDSRSALDACLRLVRARGDRLRVRVLVACGSHTYTPEQKMLHEERALPKKFPELVECGWHDAREPSLVRPLGGVDLHRWVVEGECLLAVGSMEPHYFAGVTGAHKTLTVGVMSYESLRRNHQNALSPHAAGLKLEGNPVHESIAAIIQNLLVEGKTVFAVNEVLCQGRIIGCTAGEPLEALARGLPLVRRVYARSLAGPADLIVARVAPPLDRSLYQADKGVKNVEAAVRDGGVILLDAPCKDGVGIDQFLGLLEKAPTYEDARAMVGAHGYRLGDHKAVRLRALTDSRGVRLGVVSAHLREKDAQVAGFTRFSSREEAARWANGLLGARLQTAVLVEDAGNVTLTMESGKPHTLGEGGAA